MIYTTQSKFQLGMNCRRARNWAYEFEGRGIQLRRVRIPLAVGTAVHCLSYALQEGRLEPSLEAARGKFYEDVKTRGIDLVDDDLAASLAAEQWTIAEVLLRGWWRVRRPAFYRDYSVVTVEEENMVKLADDVTLQTRSDMVVQRKSDGALFVWNWKTTGYVDSDWQARWDKSLQPLTEVLGRGDRPTEGTVIEGLYKGRKVPKDKRGGRPVYGEFGPPLAWGWKRGSEYRTSYARGFEQFPVWLEDFPGNPGLKPATYWAEWLPEEVLAEHFIETEPVLTDTVALDEVRAEIVAEERALASTTERPRNRDYCHRYSGVPCSYLAACFDAVVTDDPIESGIYEWREPNHPELVDIE